MFGGGDSGNSDTPSVFSLLVWFLIIVFIITVIIIIAIILYFLYRFGKKAFKKGRKLSA